MWHYFAQSYGTDAYGSSTYQCVEGACETIQEASFVPGIPNTGQYLLAHPPVLAGVILVVSVLIATAILMGKKLYRQSKKNSSVSK